MNIKKQFANIYICILLSLNVILKFLGIIFKGAAYTWVVYLILIFFFLYCIIDNWRISISKSEKNTLVIGYGLFAFFYLFSFLGATTFYFRSVNMILVYILYFPVSVLVCSRTIDGKSLLKTASIYARILAIMGVSLILFSVNVDYNDYMTISYVFLFFECVLVCEVLKQPKIIDIITLITLLGCQIENSARAPILFLGMFFMVMFIRSYYEIITVKKLLLGIGIILIFSVFLFNSGMLSNIIKKIGNSDSYLILQYQNNSFFQSAERIRIYKTAFSYLSKSITSILPKGLFFDRVILGGVYAHNYFLELLIDFGTVIGSVLSIKSMIFLWKTYRCSIRSDITSLYLVILFSCLLRYLLSGSFFTEPLFYLGVGLLVAIRNSVNSLEN